jgi:hypothetical protein
MKKIGLKFNEVSFGQVNSTEEGTDSGVGLVGKQSLRKHVLNLLYCMTTCIHIVIARACSQVVK